MRIYYDWINYKYIDIFLFKIKYKLDIVELCKIDNGEIKILFKYGIFCKYFLKIFYEY